MKLLTLLLISISFYTCTQTSTTPKVKTPTDLIMDHAKWQLTQDVTYDGSYRQIDYPNGDVPPDIGVCTDVIIRSYRSAGVDMQVLIYEDVKDDLSYYYPIHYKRGTAKVDPNIDHRRVHIIRKFLDKNYPDSKLKSSDEYKPGDIIIWGNWHVGILIDEKVPGTDRYYGVHNIGAGPEKSDFYYDEEELDHYRWKPWNAKKEK